MRKMVFALLVALVVVAGLWLARDRSPVGHWSSPEGQREYEAAYDAALGLMPAPRRMSDVSTAFGTVRVYEWSTEATAGKIPLVLLPGRSSGAPMWAKNLADFAWERPVFALDALGDAGMSRQEAPLENSADQARWLHEALAALGIKRMHAVGHSFGGWSVANFASRYPDAVASAVLIEPVFTVQSIKPMVLLKSIPYNLKFLPKSWRQTLILEIAGTATVDRADPIARMVDDASELYAAKLPAPDQISEEQLRAWTFPVYLALAGKSTIHDAAQGLAVAKRNIRRLDAGLWPDATHSLPMEYAGRIDREILDFVDSVDKGER